MGCLADRSSCCAARTRTRGTTRPRWRDRLRGSWGSRWCGSRYGSPRRRRRRDGEAGAWSWIDRQRPWSRIGTSWVLVLVDFLRAGRWLHRGCDVVLRSGQPVMGAGAVLVVRAANRERRWWAGARPGPSLRTGDVGSIASERLFVKRPMVRGRLDGGAFGERARLTSRPPRPPRRTRFRCRSRQDTMAAGWPSSEAHPIEGEGSR